MNAAGQIQATNYNPQVEVIRYRPGAALGWLEHGARTERRSAKAKGKAIVDSFTEINPKQIGKNTLSAAEALVHFGKSAYTSVLEKRALAHEYVLRESDFTIIRNAVMQTLKYEEIRKVELHKDVATLKTEHKVFEIRPYAHIVAGRIKVPIGWERNGMEVPFELLIEELAARCQLEVEERD